MPAKAVIALTSCAATSAIATITSRMTIFGEGARSSGTWYLRTRKINALGPAISLTAASTAKKATAEVEAPDGKASHSVAAVKITYATIAVRKRGSMTSIAAA